MKVKYLIQALQDKVEGEDCGDWPIVLWYGAGNRAAQLGSIHPMRFEGDEYDGVLRSHIITLGPGKPQGQMCLVINAKRTVKLNNEDYPILQEAIDLLKECYSDLIPTTSNQENVDDFLLKHGGDWEAEKEEYRQRTGMDWLR